MGVPEVHLVIEGLKNKDRRMLAKGISMVENRAPGGAGLLEYAYRAMREDCLVLGITGPGGAGKSTLIDKLIAAYRAQGRTVGVIAVDPSSPFTGGAVLGDRVRMGAHSADAGVFIRSLGSRGSLGGISQESQEVLYLFKAFGFDVILVESLGVGQDETEITNFVDVTAVVLVPGFGDAVQMAKAGIQEIADIFVINKSDKPEADMVYQQLIATFDMLPPEIQPLVVRTAASQNRGIDELIACVDKAYGRQLPLQEEKKRRRVSGEIAAGVRRELEQALGEQVERMLEPVLAGTLTPFAASAGISARIHIKNGAV